MPANREPYQHFKPVKTIQTCSPFLLCVLQTSIYTVLSVQESTLLVRVTIMPSHYMPVYSEILFPLFGP
jgi:hypothetical protein